MSNGNTLDDKTIYVRFKIHLPMGWSPRDFNSIGKHWHIKECQRYDNVLNSAMVTFNTVTKINEFLRMSYVVNFKFQLVEQDNGMYIETKFPSYVGKNNCTVVNQVSFMDTK